ncbi:hypothetical protein C0992_008721 [Termitomyces sp. T32_za158]|nr:hypothetical protein C0992_008721 [Termitomyces sp. T32_za158]
MAYLTDFGRRSSLHFAAGHNQLDMAKVLLEYKVDVNSKDINVAKLLLDHNADVNWTDMSSVSPLHKAIGSGQLDMVKILLDYHADIYLERDDTSALHFAVAYCQLDIVKLLLDYHADANWKALENNKEKIPPATPAPVSSKKGKQAKSVKKSDALPAKHKHAIWTDNDDKILVNTLLVQHEEGVQTSNGTFKDPAF